MLELGPSDGFPIRTLQPEPDEDVEEFAGKCEGGHTHYPYPRYLELHHVVPQSWQHAWHPGDEAYVKDQHKDLFDPRTVALCRNSHGNVHYWLSAFMHAIKNDPNGADLDEIVSSVIKGHDHVHRAEREIARQGVLRWTDAGGDPLAITNLHMYGGIYGS